MPIDHIHALPPGTRFEEYHLDMVLGAGGFGITYRAYDAHLDKFVAIKEYLPVEFATRTEASTVVPHSNADAQDYHWGLTRFLDEARTLARFKHPHLNQVYRFFESNGTAYMVLEYIQGETLADRLSREAYLEEDALQRLLDEVLSGLAVMHEAGYIHRDIKPGNLMLREEDGSAVVLDFGAARQAVGQRSKPITSILTPGYAPIEQYDSKADDVGPWSDIYALGMVAYRCISGLGDSELPDAVTRGRTQRKGQVDLMPAIEAGKGRYSPKLLEAIDWAMEVDEGDRPQGVAAWRQALAGGSRRKSPTKPVRKTAAQPARGTTTERSEMRWSNVALTVVIVALLGAGAWWGWQMYPEFFEKGDVDVAGVTEQEAPVDMPGETPQEAKTGETGEAVAGTEQTPPVDNTSQPGPAKASAENVEPELKQPATEPAKAAPAEEDEVTRLLAAAEANLKARRLTSPAWDNAWDNYQRVLELVPAHPDAVKGMEQVIESYMELFGAAVEQEAFDKAADYLAQVRELYPGYPALEEGELRLEAAKQTRADRMAKLEAIQAHMASFETALRRNDLEEASGYLGRISALDANAPELADGQQRLAEARQAEAARQAVLERQRQAEADRHVGLFEAAMQDGQLEKAAGHLAHIRAMRPDSPMLGAAEQRLAKVQEEAKERQRQAEEAARQAELERQRREAEERARAAVGEMVSIPGGTFRMGGRSDDDEKPVHTVTVPDFKLGKYEVTFAQWDACVTDGGCGGYTPDDEGWGRGNRPVINVSWDDAQAFIGWLNDKTGGKFRLPTEAEWEYSARAGSTTKYSWGTRIGSKRANCDGCGSRWDNDRTASVGSFPANAWGLHDMHGNVWEWVQDCWNDSYVGTTTDGSAWDSGDCNLRVVRGGSWYNTSEGLHSTNRNKAIYSDSFSSMGFRLVQDDQEDSNSGDTILNSGIQ